MTTADPTNHHKPTQKETTVYQRIRKTLRLWQSAWRRRHDPPFTPPKPAVPSTVGIHASRLVAKFLIDTAVAAGADRLLARQIALHALRVCGEPVVMHHPTVGFGLLTPPMRIDGDGAMEWLAHDPMTRPPAAPSVLADLAAESVAQLGAVDEAVEIGGMVLLPVDRQTTDPRVDPRELEFDPLAPMSVRVEFDPQIAPVGLARCYVAEDGSLRAVVATSRDRIAGLRKIHPGPWWLAAGVIRGPDRLREVSAVAGVADGGQPPWLPAEPSAAPHLVAETSDRGFDTLPPVPGTHGGQPAGHAQARESSAASGPHLWLEVVQPSDRNHPDNGETIEAAIHITATDAWRFADQIRHLVTNHYQGDARPAWAR